LVETPKHLSERMQIRVLRGLGDYPPDARVNEPSRDGATFGRIKRVALEPRSAIRADLVNDLLNGRWIRARLRPRALRDDRIDPPQPKQTTHNQR